MHTCLMMLSGCGTVRHDSQVSERDGTCGALAQIVKLQARNPPAWRDSCMKYISVVGKVLMSGMNGMRCDTTLEQNADFVAEDLETYESQWSGKTVGNV